MENIIKRRIVLSILLVLLLLAAIPTAAIQAQQTANSSDSCPYTERWFGDGATVESVTQELLKVSPDITVTITDKDGNPRTTGPLAEGDLITIRDRSGKLYQCFININPESSSENDENLSEPSQSVSEVPSSSVDPESSETPASEKPADYSSESEKENSQPVPPQSSPESPSEPSVKFFSKDGRYYKFNGPVSVSDLQNQLLEQGVPGSQLTIFTRSGMIRQSGAVCTGDILTVENQDGALQNRITAVIPGDLTRCGSPNKSACRILYDYLTGSVTLKTDLRRAADLNGDTDITTSDLLALKKLLTEEGL
ncbi:MAG: hypothetical protein LKJ17_02935 [Oscillospiraceae bacterium]|nr:hypothetical protein [Oscillospiraceae bacterium]